MFKLGHSQEVFDDSDETIEFHIAIFTKGHNYPICMDRTAKSLCCECSTLILYKNICEICLDMCNANEIEALKHFLIVQKLKGK